MARSGALTPPTPSGAAQTAHTGNNAAPSAGHVATFSRRTNEQPWKSHNELGYRPDRRRRLALATSLAALAARPLHHPTAASQVAGLRDLVDAALGRLSVRSLPRQASSMHLRLVRSGDSHRRSRIRARGTDRSLRRVLPGRGLRCDPCAARRWLTACRCLGAELPARAVTARARRDPTVAASRVLFRRHRCLLLSSIRDTRVLCTKIATPTLAAMIHQSLQLDRSAPSSSASVSSPSAGGVTCRSFASLHGIQMPVGPGSSRTNTFTLEYVRGGCLGRLSAVRGVARQSPVVAGGLAWKVTPDRDGSFRPLIEMCSRTCRCVKVCRRNHPDEPTAHGRVVWTKRFG